MPYYDYKCERCDLVFGRLTPNDAADKQDCPVCGKLAIRLPSAPAFTITGYNAKNGYSR